MSRGDQGFWARRRAAVAAETRTEEEARRAREKAEAEAALEAEQAGKSDAEILEELGLPDPDTMTEGDDVTAFMARAVPQHLRNRALRRLWRSNPVLACLDGLNDYDDDYLAGSTGNGVIATSYRVGQGLKAHVDTLRAAAEGDAKADADAAPEDAPLAQAALRNDDAPEADAARADAPGDGTEAAPVQETETETDAEQAASTDAPPRPRRMRFTFDDEEA